MSSATEVKAVHLFRLDNPTRKTVILADSTGSAYDYTDLFLRQEARRDPGIIVIAILWMDGRSRSFEYQLESSDAINACLAFHVWIELSTPHPSMALDTRDKRFLKKYDCGMTRQEFESISEYGLPFRAGQYADFSVPD